MTVREIVEKYLEDNGYDGLYNTDKECACSLSDLIPCCDGFHDCEPGHEVPCPAVSGGECPYNCSGEYDYHMVAGPRKGF